MKIMLNWFIVMSLVLVAGFAEAQLVWTGNVNNVWNTSDPNWLNAGVSANFADGNGVVFDDTALVTTNINISGTVSPGSLLFSNTTNATGKAYSFTNGVIAGGCSVSKTGSGAVTFGSPSGGGLSGASPISISEGTLISCAQGALGTGPITFNRSAVVGRDLKFDTVSQTVPNSITLSGNTGAVRFVANNNVSFTGLVDLGTKGTNNSLSFAGTSSLEFKPSNRQSLSGMTNYWVIGAADNNNPAVSFPLGMDLPAEVSVKMNGGLFVLSSNMTWSQFAAHHTFVNNTPSVGQWSINSSYPEFNGGFAAKDSPQVIDGVTGGFSNVVNIANFILGSSVTNADGTFFANAPVEISMPMVLSSNAWQAISIAVNGPGFGATTSSHVIQKISGSLSGPGALRFAGRGTVSDSLVGNAEVVLSGSNSYTGGLMIRVFGSNGTLLTGPGGMAINPRSSVIVRFNGNGSLPTGNAGKPSYLTYLSYETDPIQQGYMVTGVTNGNAVYRLTDGYKFVLQGGGSCRPIFGSTEGNATLRGSEISAFGYDASKLVNLYLLIRDGSMTLGAAGEPVLFTSSTCIFTNGNTGPSSADATPLLDRTNTTTLIKRSAGTLTLNNVQYTKIDKVTNISGSYIWQVGESVFNGLANNGVVRETGIDSFKSIRGMVYSMNGGILGLAADYDGVVGTNTPAGEINLGYPASPWGYVNTGAGFGAYGGKRTVTLTPKSGNKFTWASMNVASDYFVYNGAPLIFNAPDADGEIVLASASTNSISLNSAARTIVVYDNPATNTDWATLSIPIIDASASAALVKAGNGLLNLSATNNNWAGVTSVSNGTLNVNGVLLARATNVIVYSGATLGGTGTIMRAVSVLNGGTLTAGAGSNQTGTLTISSNLVLSSGATVSVNVGGTSPGQYSVIAVGGSNVVSLTGVTLAVNLNGYDLAGGSDLTIMTTPSGFGGTTFTSVTQHGYSARFSGNNLLLHRDSPGLTIRVQ